MASSGLLEDLGFFVYYTKGKDTNSLNSPAKLSGAMSNDAKLGKADKRMPHELLLSSGRRSSSSVNDAWIRIRITWSPWSPTARP